MLRPLCLWLFVFCSTLLFPFNTASGGAIRVPTTAMSAIATLQLGDEVIIRVEKDTALGDEPGDEGDVTALVGKNVFNTDGLAWVTVQTTPSEVISGEIHLGVFKEVLPFDMASSHRANAELFAHVGGTWQLTPPTPDTPHPPFLRFHVSASGFYSDSFVPTEETPDNRPRVGNTVAIFEFRAGWDTPEPIDFRWGFSNTLTTIFDGCQFPSICGFIPSGDIDESLLLIDPLSGDGVYGFQMSVMTSSLAYTFGHGHLFSDLFFGQTVSIDSITLPDGRTPEEAGFTLTSSFGVQSPNIPEPSSLTLAALGVIALCSRRYRRRC